MALPLLSTLPFKASRISLLTSSSVRASDEQLGRECFLLMWTFSCALQDDHRGFRRQLEDKRPIVENNLLSGRQYIANEPPLSDTSDSEGEFVIFALSSAVQVKHGCTTTSV